MKVSGDLRLLSSGPDAGLGEIRLPARQAGSSIMPGKVNPVIPEAVTQAGLVVMGNDQVIASAVSMGSLELNAFLPLVADALLGSLDLLANACRILRTFCVENMTADAVQCRRAVDNSTGAVTALVERLGYETAQRAAQAARAEGRSIRDIVLERGLLDAAEYDRLVSAESVLRLGSAGSGRDTSAGGQLDA